MSIRTLVDIPTLLQYFGEITSGSQCSALFARLSLIKGDITKLAIDAIANAANSSLLGGGGVDGCIHRAAGSGLVKECSGLGGCKAGSAKITGGYGLPAKHVIHCVGPQNSSGDILASCYQAALNLCSQHEIKSIAFPCIATGIYGFPNRDAAKIAIDTVCAYIKEHSEIERVIFCCFLEEDFNHYSELLHLKSKE